MTMQSKSYQLYVFDWDGTVMDTTGLIARGMQQACVTLGYPQPDLDACRETIGLPFAESFARVAPGFRYEQLDDFLTAYRNWYLQREAQVDVMAGLEDLFDRMTKNGLRLAVATGKSRAGLIRVFERTGLGKYFEATVTADESFPKPNPAMLEKLSDETGVDVREMVMIGDSIHDLQLAQNARCDAVAVTWGAARLPELQSYPAVAYVSDVKELIRALSLSYLYEESQSA